MLTMTMLDSVATSFGGPVSIQEAGEKFGLQYSISPGVIFHIYIHNPQGLSKVIPKLLTCSLSPRVRTTEVPEYLIALERLALCCRLGRPPCNQKLTL